MHPRLRLALLLLCVLLVGGRPDEASAQARPEGEMRWALYVTLSPQWFDPAEVSGQITPFWVLYALHDALVKPMPGNLMAPSLAESWTVSAGSEGLRVQAAGGAEVPQRRPVHRRGREVQLSPLQGLEDPARQGPRDRGGEPEPRALRPAGAVAGLHDLLRHHGDGRRLDRAQEVRGAGGQRRFQEAPDRAGALQVREQHRPASSW